MGLHNDDDSDDPDNVNKPDTCYKVEIPLEPENFTLEDVLELVPDASRPVGGPPNATGIPVQRKKHVPHSHRRQYQPRPDLEEYFFRSAQVRRYLYLIGQHGDKLRKYSVQFAKIDNPEFQKARWDIERFLRMWEEQRIRLQMHLTRLGEIEAILQLINMCDECESAEEILSCEVLDARERRNLEKYREVLQKRIHSISLSLQYLRYIYPLEFRVSILELGVEYLDVLMALVMDKEVIEDDAKENLEIVKQFIEDNREIYDSRPSSKTNEQLQYENDCKAREPKPQTSGGAPAGSVPSRNFPGDQAERPLPVKLQSPVANKTPLTGSNQPPAPKVPRNTTPLSFRPPIPYTDELYQVQTRRGEMIYSREEIFTPAPELLSERWQREFYITLTAEERADADSMRPVKPRKSAVPVRPRQQVSPPTLPPVTVPFVQYPSYPYQGHYPLFYPGQIYPEATHYPQFIFPGQVNPYIQYGHPQHHPIFATGQHQGFVPTHRRDYPDYQVPSGSGSRLPGEFSSHYTPSSSDMTDADQTEGLSRFGDLTIDSEATEGATGTSVTNDVTDTGAAPRKHKSKKKHLDTPEGRTPRPDSPPRREPGESACDLINNILSSEQTSQIQNLSGHVEEWLVLNGTHMPKVTKRLGIATLLSREVEGCVVTGSRFVKKYADYNKFLQNKREIDSLLSKARTWNDAIHMTLKIRRFVIKLLKFEQDVSKHNLIQHTSNSTGAVVDDSGNLKTEESDKQSCSSTDLETMRTSLIQLLFKLNVSTIDEMIGLWREKLHLLPNTHEMEKTPNNLAKRIFISVGKHYSGPGRIDLTMSIRRAYILPETRQQVCKKSIEGCLSENVSIRNEYDCIFNGQYLNEKKVECDDALKLIGTLLVQHSKTEKICKELRIGQRETRKRRALILELSNLVDRLTIIYQDAKTVAKYLGNSNAHVKKVEVYNLNVEKFIDSRVKNIRDAGSPNLYNILSLLGDSWMEIEGESTGSLQISQIQIASIYENNGTDSLEGFVTIYSRILDELKEKIRHFLTQKEWGP